MEDRYGTTDRKIAPSGPDPPPLKPVRQIRRPEMYPSRRMQEQRAASLPQHPPQPVPRSHPWEPSIPRTAPLRKSASIQNVSQTDTPWESITLNRCLFVAITILLVTSGLQKLNETLRGHRTTHEESGLSRHRSALKHRVTPSEPQTSLWEVIFWWVPDLTDEDDEDDEEGDKTNSGRSKRSAADRISRGLRHRPLLEKLMKPRENKLKDRRKTRDVSDGNNKLKEENGSLETETEDSVNEEEKEEEASAKSKSQMQKKEKPKIHKV